jgi:hypothetical protein
VHSRGWQCVKVRGERAFRTDADPYSKRMTWNQNDN